MVKRWVMLTFTSETISEAIIYNLGHQFDVVTNIRQAQVSEDEGWIVLELEGEGKDIEDGIAWVISKGVRVEPFGGET